MHLPTRNHPAFFSFSSLSRCAIHWAPRTCAAGMAGFYSLGIAYEKGLMAVIDRIAIQVLKPQVGYLGLGAIMPTIQWYSAWGVRLTAALLAGLIYDIVERIALSIFPFHFDQKPHPSSHREKSPFS